MKERLVSQLIPSQSDLCLSPYIAIDIDDIDIKCPINKIREQAGRAIDKYD